MRRIRRGRLAAVIFSIALIAVGIGVIAQPLYDLWHRSQSDSNALAKWDSGGSNSVTGAAHDQSTPTPGSCNPDTIPKSLYALVTFPSLQQYGYAGVAVDGNWDDLLQHSMVHWHGSADPGTLGNDIIAFHREPNYEHIDQLKVGDVVNVQNRQCQTYGYKIVGKATLDPNKVTQLTQTNGYDLTLITCTPWWQDTQRIVWRASLVSKNGKPVTSA